MPKNRGVLDLLNCVQIHARLGCFYHSITMEALRPARYKTAKIHRIEHTPGNYAGQKVNFKQPISVKKTAKLLRKKYTECVAHLRFAK